jgi:signal peptidase I
MSDMPFDAEARQTSPFISIWWRPRQTIERIVAGRPGHLVLPLAALSGAASAVGMLTTYGAGSKLTDWRALLACVVGGGILGIVNLYVLAAVTGWLARKMGGQASAAAVRAVFAWGALPSILGIAVILSIAAGWRILADGAGAEPRSLAILGDYVIGACGLWSMVLTMLMLSRVERFGFWRAIAAYAAGALLLSTILALIVRTFLFHPFNIPAGSMTPTLLVGDHFFSSKFAYGYTRFSLPFSLPLFSGRIFGSDPARGDVIVFRLPKDTSTDYVKRVVGLPGDRIQMKEGELHINGTAVKRERMVDFEESDACGGGPAKVKRWRETLPEGASYETLDCVDRGFYDSTNVFTVPAGHLFVLGDNRDNSTDSRVLSAVGYIPVENVIGRVGMIFFSLDAGGNGTPPAIRYGRIGTVVQ